MRLLVTGANGCVGSAFVKRALERDHNAIALALDQRDTDKIGGFAGLEIEYGDVCDSSRLDELLAKHSVDAIVHLAAAVHDSHVPEQKYMDVNYKATADLLNKARKHGVRHFIFISTAAVYGEEASEANEETPVCPVTPYAISKLKAEEYIEQNHGTVEYTIMRPTTVYGEHDRGNVGKLFRLATKGVVPLIGDGNNVKSFVYVEHLAEALMHTILNPVVYGQTLIITDPRPYSLNTFLREMATAMDKRIIVIHFPAGAAIAIAKLVDLVRGVAPGAGKPSALSFVTKLIANNTYDGSKAKRLLIPTAGYSLSQAMRSMASYNRLI